MTAVLAVLAGGLGAVARYAIAGTVQGRVASSRPWGTAVVNVTGALVLGVVVGAVGAERWPAEILVVVGAGFLGSYTTFSTWMFETVRLAETGGRAGVVAGLGNVVWPLAVGLAGAVAGYVVGGWL